MKYKLLPLLVYLIILANPIYGQQPDVLHWSGTGAMVDTDGHYFGGPFGGGSLEQQLISLHADVYWHGDIAQYGDGTRSGVIGGGVGVEEISYQYTFTIENSAPGSATLYLEKSKGDSGIVTLGNMTPIFIGHIYKDQLGKLFDRNGQRIDPPSRQPINQTTSSSDGGSGSGSSGGDGGIIMGSVSYGGSSYDLTLFGGFDTVTTYEVCDASGGIVGWGFYDSSDGSEVITGQLHEPDEPGLTPSEVKEIIDRYRREG